MISVSLDENLDVLRAAVNREGMNWPQICDAKGTDTELARLFNALTPTHYVIDRDGTIAAKHMGALGLHRMRATISRLLAK